MNPKFGSNGGAPTSTRIIQDVERCIGLHLWEIVKAKGAVVHGLGDRIGRRWIEGTKKRGGHRTKLQCQPSQWLHPDAVEAKHASRRASTEKYLMSRQYDSQSSREKSSSDADVSDNENSSDV